jgi:DNA-binding TFAR19-related protein (PDSD5 family)
VEDLDEEIERLRMKRMLELQRMIRKREEEQRAEKTDPRSILGRYFRDRAWEVYEAAWAQFPTVMPHVERALVEAISSGRIKQEIDGESLYQFLRAIGLPVRLRTTIRYKEHGELKTLEQKIREGL